MGQHPPDFAATKAKPQLAPYHFRSVLPRHFKDCPSFGTAHGVTSDYSTSPRPERAAKGGRVSVLMARPAPIASKKPGRFALRLLRCRFIQAQPMLTLKRRNTASTIALLRRRTRLLSSNALTSSRLCSPLSIPQYSRLSASICPAPMRACSRLVSRWIVCSLTSPPGYSICWLRRAAWAAKGKPTLAPLTGVVSIARVSCRLLFTPLCAACS
jgi:hypothetical protein